MKAYNPYAVGVRVFVFSQPFFRLTKRGRRKMFKKITGSQISKAIVGEFTKWFNEYIVCDVIVVGSSPAALLRHAI